MPRYDQYEYLWPPRPESAVAPSKLVTFERMGFVAQTKINGTCNVMAVAPSGDVIAKNRHKEDHKLWAPTDASIDAFQDLPGEGWYVFVAELIHSKVKGGPRDTNYIHDVLVADGEYLIGSTMQERQDILHSLFEVDPSRSTISHEVVNDNTWLVRNHRKGFSDLFKSLKEPYHEGLVLKDPNARLAYCSREGANCASMVKCRRNDLSPNFSF